MTSASRATTDQAKLPMAQVTFGVEERPQALRRVIRRSRNDRLAARFARGRYCRKSPRKRNVKLEMWNEQIHVHGVLIQDCAFVPDLESMLLRDSCKFFFDSIGHERKNSQ